MFKTWTGSAND